MDEIEKIFKKLGILNEVEKPIIYPFCNEFSESFQIRLDNVSKELFED